MRPILLFKTKKMYVFTLNTTLVILILISRINEATRFSQSWSLSDHPVS